MRVRCERFLSTLGSKDGRETESGPGGLTKGTEYLVLSFCVDQHPVSGILSVRLLLLDDYRRPQWAAAAMFSVTRGDIPSTWRTWITPAGEWELSPAAWQSDGFWGHYHGTDTELVVSAHEIFRQELAAMEAEDAYDKEAGP